ncbi:MAG: translation initiation factor IF-2 [Polyangia bacterium]
MTTGERASGAKGAADAAAKQVRLYEVAKDLGLTNKDLIEKVRALGIEVKNHMSNLETEDVTRVRRSLDKERQSNLVEERLSSTVIRRRTRDGAPLRPAPAPEPPPAPRPVVTARAEAPIERAAPPRPVEARVEEKRPTPAPAIEAKPVVEARPVVEAKPVEKPVIVEPAKAATPAPVLAKPPEPVQRRVVVETSRTAGGPIVETRQSANAPIAAAGAPGAAPGAPAAPGTPEPIKYGPTGRMIDLGPRYQIQERAPGAGPRGPGGAAPGMRRDAGPAGRFGRPSPSMPAKKRAPMGKSKQTQITTPAAHKRILKMEETVAVGEIAKQMGVKATDVLKKLWSMGMTGITLNNAIDQDTATLLANDFGFEIESTAFQESDVFASAADNEEDLVTRAPVVTIMGHVDHGKTSLLDAIRETNVAAGEAGGITQHIGAYKVKTASGQEVVFLDTPGHEAFTAMRARGAQATDIVVLVVAADDGVMPTTIEALKHAKEAGVKIIVAVNKIDKQGAQPERIRQQLSDHGLVPEAWGGDTIYVDLSARTKVGVDTLLEMLALQTDVLELRANPNKAAKGIVIESKLDRNRGPMATILVQEGTLRAGDTVVAGEFVGKVRAMLDDKGRTLASAGPSTPVELLGLGGVPDAGESLNVATDEKQAKELVEHRRDTRRRKELAGTSRVTLENILDKIKAGAVKELKIVLKTDVQGSSEAVKNALQNLTNDQVKVDVIMSGVGGITESDVNLAKAGNAIIVGFHVRPAGKAAQLAESEGVDVKLYNIIYEAIDDVRKAMVGLLAPVKREKPLGKAEVRQLFVIPKLGQIAGSYVTEGLIRRNSQMRLVRDSVQIYIGKLTSLRRFKDDAREVQSGYECGIGLENFNDIQIGDIIEAYEIEEVAAVLNEVASARS